MKHKVIVRVHSILIYLLSPVRMVSIIAKNLKDKRQYKALVAIFEEADVSGDGKYATSFNARKLHFQNDNLTYFLLGTSSMNWFPAFV